MFKNRNKRLTKEAKLVVESHYGSTTAANISPSEAMEICTDAAIRKAFSLSEHFPVTLDKKFTFANIVINTAAIPNRSLLVLGQKASFQVCSSRVPLGKCWKSLFTCETAMYKLAVKIYSRKRGHPGPSTQQLQKKAKKVKTKWVEGTASRSTDELYAEKKKARKAWKENKTSDLRAVYDVAKAAYSIAKKESRNLIL